MSTETIKRSDVIFGAYTVEKYQVLKVTLKRSPEEIIDDIIESGIRGRGGAGFPTGLKWKIAAAQPGPEKFVICNADEGEPGTFKDREILLRVPRKVFTGMAICGYVIGADKGIVYLRGEYAYMLPHLYEEIEILNATLKELNHTFSIEIRMGSGAYVCGEETALIESIEGKRGEPRNKPPFPVAEGLFDKPTVVNNVETFVNATMICKMGPAEFDKLGTRDSRGSKLFSVSGDTPKPGVYELELGMKLSDFVEAYGDGDTKAVQVGGASGFCVPRKKFEETIIGFEGVPTGGSMMLFNNKRSMYNVLHNYLEFFCEESCGQCTPCRIGTQQLRNGLQAIKNKEKNEDYLQTLMGLTETMKIASKCGLGQSVANAFGSIVDNFTEEMIY
jgi:[NiFe] hydrogenase diaphorase moiety large subunit